MSEVLAGLIEVTPSDDVQQGDLFRVLSSLDDLANASAADAEWCLVLTADCDIAQNKLDSCFTVLSIVTATKWLESIWADEKLDQSIDKGLLELSTKIWAHDKARDPAVLRLTKSDTLRLVLETPEASIEEAFGGDKVFGRSIAEKFLAIKAALLGQQRGEQLKAWMGWKRHLGATHKSISTEIREAVGNMRGGYFFLPRLPNHPIVGHVVLLRDIRAAPLDNVFRRSLDIRNTQRSAPYFLRMGRLSDNLRHAIAQQVAVLFSRVGLPASFEEECDAAAGMASETVIARLGLNNV